MAYTTLNAIKNYGGFEDGEDVVLSALMGSARDIINQITNRVFDADESTERYFTRHRGIPDRFDNNKLFLDEDLAEEASHITDTPTVIYLPENDPPFHSIVVTAGSWNAQEVIINGYWGYSKTAPPSIELACIKLVKWLYDQRDTTKGTSVIVTPEGQVLLPEGFPSDVMAILGPYIKIVVVG